MGHQSLQRGHNGVSSHSLGVVTVVIRAMSNRRLREAALAAAVSAPMVALQACGEATSSMGQRARGTNTPVVVTENLSKTRGNCGPEGAAGILSSFAAAYSRGAVATTARVFDSPDFRWYTVNTGRDRFERFTDPKKLPSFFSRRRQQGELLRLEEVSVTAPRTTRERGLLFRFYRRARDLRRYGVSNRLAAGKAQMNCSAGKLIVWSMSTPPGPSRQGPRLCPAPERPPPPRAVIACGR